MNTTTPTTTATKPFALPIATEVEQPTGSRALIESLKVEPKAPKTSVLEDVSAMLAKVKTLPGRVNDSISRGFSAIHRNYGFGGDILTAVVTGGGAIWTGMQGAAIASGLTQALPYGNSMTSGWAQFLGFVAGAAPLVTGWINARFSDGPVRGIAEGLVAPATFLGSMALASSIGASASWGNWFAIAGLVGAGALFASGVSKRTS